MAELKAAVIGVGSMGSRHARVYAELPQTELVAVADASDVNSSQVADRYGIRPYLDYEKMLAAENPDVVTVAVPTIYHLDVAKKALAAGCHVLVEKPIAASIEDAQALIAAAAEANRKLMVGHIVRFDPTVQALKQHVADGKLCRIFQIVCRRVGPFPHRIRDVGVVLDLAPHDLDVMRYITGEEALRVYAETAQHIHAEHEDLLAAQLRFTGGITGMLNINWLTPTKIRDIVVLGEKGMARADSILQNLYFYKNAAANGDVQSASSDLKDVSEGRMTRFQPQRNEPLKAELTAFVTAVLNNTPVPVTGTDGLIALRLALALIKSGAEHRTVEVGL